MFVNGLANIKDDRNGKWGDINTKGKYMFQPRYDNTYCFTKGHNIPPIKAAGKRGLILIGREAFRRYFSHDNHIFEHVGAAGRFVCNDL